MRQQVVSPREALRQWFERLGRLAPTLQLTVHDVWVKGGPWNTIVIIRWYAGQDLPGGSPYNNHGVHVIRMRWGKVFDIDANDRAARRRVRDARQSGGEYLGNSPSGSECSPSDSLAESFVAQFA